MIVTIVIYLPGYPDFSSDGSHAVSDCSPSAAFRCALDHVGFFFALIGNIVPGGILFW